MRTYIFSVSNGSNARGFNQTVRVWRLKNNVPHFVGSNNRINTASSCGECGEARKVINEIDGVKLKNNQPYNFDSVNVQLFEV